MEEFHITSLNMKAVKENALKQVKELGDFKIVGLAVIMVDEEQGARSTYTLSSEDYDSEEWE